MLILRIARHLLLREARYCDALEIYASIREQRAHLGRWLPFVEQTRCLNDTVAYLRGVANAVPPQPVFTIRTGPDQRFAGLIGFPSVDPQSGTAQIGYWLREEYQGRGIVTRSVRRLCRYAFREMGLRRIEIKCATRNIRSNRIPERLGFRLCRIEYRAELLSDGHRTNLKVYVLERRPPLSRWLRHPLTALRELRTVRARIAEPVPPGNDPHVGGSSCQSRLEIAAAECRPVSFRLRSGWAAKGIDGKSPPPATLAGATPQ